FYATARKILRVSATLHPGGNLHGVPERGELPGEDHELPLRAAVAEPPHQKKNPRHRASARGDKDELVAAMAVVDRKLLQQETTLAVKADDGVGPLGLIGIATDPVDEVAPPGHAARGSRIDAHLGERRAPEEALYAPVRKDGRAEVRRNQKGAPQRAAARIR